MKASISAILITKNEALDLPECLRSLKPLSSEIVVVDGGSSDETVRLARDSGARVHAVEFKDYASQKQAALDLASGDWALSIDADERVSPGLAKEILSVLEADGPADGYEIPFEVEFLGRVLRFGGLGRERHLRLFRRKAGSFIGGKLHEGVELNGTLGRLSGRMRHIPYRDLDEYLEKLGRYTTWAAQKRWEAGRRASAADCFLRPLWELFLRLVLRLGILDGTPGAAWAVLSSFHTWLKYVKLMEIGRARLLPASASVLQEETRP
ncbi:MAG: glycosyltransferase family 2 protein [Elusimicrobiota bacterium]|jgi:glycosyltransferase involved in cell wall biosynthesis